VVKSFNTVITMYHIILYNVNEYYVTMIDNIMYQLSNKEYLELLSHSQTLIYDYGYIITDLMKQ